MEIGDKKENAPKNHQEQNVKNTSIDTTLSNKGIIYITGEEQLNDAEKTELTNKIDNLIGKYTHKRYGIYLILSRFE